jgi:hypothetical protein
LTELSVGIIFDNTAETGFAESAIFAFSFANARSTFFAFLTLDFFDPDELLLPDETDISSGILSETSFASELADIPFPSDDSFDDITTTQSYPSEGL